MKIRKNMEDIHKDDDDLEKYSANQNLKSNDNKNIN